jgi:ferredoxin, 2Fe-2S
MTEDGLIQVTVRDPQGNTWNLEAPTDMSLNLMEVMKGEGVAVLATCGGMALCATCHVLLKKGGENLPEPGDAELDMLDTLPELQPTSRLSCQIKICPELDGAEFDFAGEDNV